MSEPQDHAPASREPSLERSREEVLAAARPLPPDDEVVIEDLSEEEDQIFLDVILNSCAKSPAGRSSSTPACSAPG